MSSEGPRSLDQPEPVQEGWLQGLEIWLDGALFSRALTVGSVLSALGLAVAVAAPTMGGTRSTRLRQDAKRATVRAAANPAPADVPAGQR